MTTMKGILKIYHPEETLKYHLKSSYCKAVYSNAQNFLEVEVITDESLDHVEDDSLQYRFPQLSFSIFDFPISNQDLSGKSFFVEDNDDEVFTEVNLFDDEEAFLYENELIFSHNEEQQLQLIWKGKIDDFYTASGTPISFKLKCHFKEEEIDIEE